MNIRKNFVILNIICGIFAGIFSLGCATTSTNGTSTTNTVNWTKHVSALVKGAAYVGTFEDLKRNPDHLDKYNTAVGDLRFLEANAVIDWTTVLMLVQSFPQKELQSETAQLSITLAMILLTEVETQTKTNLTGVVGEDAKRAIVVALREGIELGITGWRRYFFGILDVKDEKENILWTIKR